MFAVLSACASAADYYGGADYTNGEDSAVAVNKSETAEGYAGAPESVTNQTPAEAKKPPVGGGVITPDEAQDETECASGGGLVLTNSYDRLGNDCQRQIYRRIAEKSHSVSDLLSSYGDCYVMEPVDCGFDGVEKSDIKIAFNAFKTDNPGCFWISVDCIISESSFFGAKLNMLSLYSPEELSEMEKKFALKTAEITSQIPAAATAYEKEVFLHDRLIDICDYDDNALRKTGDSLKYSDSYNAYGAIVNGAAVCQGYAEAYSCLLALAGVNNTVITGEDHVWNAVQLDSEWYNADVTWDDTTGSSRYLNMPDAKFSAEHTPSPLFSDLTEQEILGSDTVPARWFNFMKV